jgi:hypothetical protein
MSDILLDRRTHDIIVGDYDLPLVRGVDLIRQRLKQRLLTILGEWFLNGEIGLPWFQEFSQKGIDDDRVRALIIRQIAETEGVDEIVEFDFSLDRRARRLVVNFRVTSPEGDIPLELTI